MKITTSTVYSKDPEPEYQLYLEETLHYIRLRVRDAQGLIVPTRCENVNDVVLYISKRTGVVSRSNWISTKFKGLPLNKLGQLCLAEEVGGE